MSNSTQPDCTSVSPDCPVDRSIYGYYPSLSANAFFCAFFGVCLIAQIAMGIRWRTWTFMLAMVLGCLTESVGYIGRILLHGNPFSAAGFEVQICCLVIAPAFFSAAIYLTLKHIVLAVGSEWSRFRPKYYTWAFISVDIFSLVLQGIGGGIAATSISDPSLQKAGTDTLLAGIVWQVVTLLVFASLVADYFSRVYKNRLQLNQTGLDTLQNRKIRAFLAAVFFAFTTLFIRFLYRIPELSGGWKSPVMQNETDFIVLDGVMVSIATLVLTVFHPGYYFKSMHNRTLMSEKDVESNSKMDIEIESKV